MDIEKMMGQTIDQASQVIGSRDAVISKLRTRISDLEGALHCVWSLNMSLQAEIHNDGPDTSMAEINGRLVEIAEECARVVGPNAS